MAFRSDLTAERTGKAYRFFGPSWGSSRGTVDQEVFEPSGSR